MGRPFVLRVENEELGDVGFYGPFPTLRAALDAQQRFETFSDHAYATEVEELMSSDDSTSGWYVSRRAM